MRHGNKVNHLGRKYGHRVALLKNMSCSLILHKRINTTLAKAKVLRSHLEPLVTKAKNNTTHSRRVVFSYLQDKEAAKELFGVIADRIGDRPGGYLRIIKTGFRLGDGASTAMIEFVDFNETYVVGGKSTAGKKRTRRSAGKKTETSAAEVKNVKDSATIVQPEPEIVDDEIEEIVDDSASVETSSEDVEESTQDDSDNDHDVSEEGEDQKV